MAILGAHQSIAGGCHRAVERAKACGCQCVQLFTKNSNQWGTRPLAPDEMRQFRNALAELRITHPIAHDSYLINLGSPDCQLWEKSVAALVDELHRASCLGIPYVVAHPGAFTTGSEEQGLANVVRALNAIDSETKRRNITAQCLLETTAGQGTTLGHRFEQFSTILRGVDHPERIGFCFDTCHVYAAGYPLARKEDYDATMREFDRLVGLDRIKAFHLNDSRRELGSRVDRHEHIGRGAIGIEAFRNLLQDKRFDQVPMYLETPKGEEDGRNLDAVNLQTLRDLFYSATGQE